MIKKENGITLVTLIFAIVLMLIISSVIIYNANAGLSVRALNNMYSDITILKNKVDIYYAKYGTLPIIKTEYTNVAHISNINVNDNGNYYVIDLQSLENITLTYGADYTSYKATPNNEKTDLYVINEQSHTIYYVKGIELDEITYYTTQGLYTKVEIPPVNVVTLIEKKYNTATIEIKAADKANGIQSIILYVNDEIYETYEYTETKESSTELVDILLTEGNTIIYINTTSANGISSESERLVIESEI